MLTIENVQTAADLLSLVPLSPEVAHLQPLMLRIPSAGSLFDLFRTAQARRLSVAEFEKLVADSVALYSQPQRCAGCFAWCEEFYSVMANGELHALCAACGEEFKAQGETQVRRNLMEYSHHEPG